MDTYAKIRPGNKLTACEIIDSTLSFARHLDERDSEFQFTRIFDQESTQENVYSIACKATVARCLDGYNGTIFAYGQTGSGKSFTIAGGDRYQDRGIIPRAISTLFEESEKRTDDYTYQLFISYMEIYNETAYDLLDRPNQTGEMWKKVKLMDDSDGEIHFHNLGVYEVSSEEQALKLFFLGNVNRVTSATMMNQTSSRSHSVFSVVIDGRKRSSEEIISSKLHLVDLAGSERLAKSQSKDQLKKEGKHINLSLHYLEQVIRALQRSSINHEKNIFIPYRNSMLTSVLRGSLGGNCKSIFIATLSPRHEDFEESLSTCRFMRRCREISVEILVNKKVDPVIQGQRLEEENQQLRARIQDLESELAIQKTCSERHESQAVDEQLSKEIVEKLLHSQGEVEVSSLLKDIETCGLPTTLQCCKMLTEEAIAHARNATEAIECVQQNEQKLQKLEETVEQLRRKLLASSAALSNIDTDSDESLVAEERNVATDLITEENERDPQRNLESSINQPKPKIAIQGVNTVCPVAIEVQEHESVSEAIKRRITLLCSGALFIKHGRRGKPHVRFVWCSEDLQYIYYRHIGARDPKMIIPANLIQQVHLGHSTKILKRSRTLGRDECCLSLEYGCGRTLDLEIDEGDASRSRERCHEWYDGFLFLMKLRKVHDINYMGQVSANDQTRRRLSRGVDELSLMLGAENKDLMRDGWEQRVKAHPDIELPITIALRISQKSIDTLERGLWEASGPSLETYGNHWTNQEITDVIQADESTIERVTGFLKDQGVRNIRLSKNRDYIHAIGTVRVLERILEVTFHHFSKLGSDIQYIRSGSPLTVPIEIEPYISFIAHVDNLPPVPHIEQHGHPVGQVISNSSGDIEDYPYVLAPTNWRGENVTVMAALRCSDGNFRRQDLSCPRKIDQVLVSINPKPEKLRATVAAFKPYSLFHSPDPECKVCSEFSYDHYTRGQLTRHLCSTMRDQLNAPNDTLFCRLTAEGAELATPSTINVATVFEPVDARDGGLHNTVSQESQCLAGWSLQNCSKTVTLMPDVTPNYLKSLYNIPEGLVGSHPDNCQAVSAFLNEHYSEADLSIFLDAFNIQPKRKVHTVIGPNDPTAPTGEASLDVQTILGIAPNISTWYWSVGGLREDTLMPSDANQEPFLKWILDYNAIDEPPFPLVHSISYDDDELTQPIAFTERMNVEFIKAGLLGRTLLFAAGDDGCGGQRVRNEGSKACDKFNPEWPSTSPYVTSVGGTIMGRVSDNGNGPMEEVVSDVIKGSFITTGGGFSYRNKRPAYQEGAVKHYLEHVELPPQHFFNSNGRGYPDISAISTNYLIQLSPRGFIPIAGTSASTPAVAGMISLINDERLHNGLPPLGFLNPMIYKLAQDHPEAFNDVRFGQNNCSAVPESCCPYGFKAAEGWDPTTGVGTPNVGRLINLLGKKHSPFHDNTLRNTTESSFGHEQIAILLLLAICFTIGGTIVRRRRDHRGFSRLQ